ncbi:hypothetical protein CCP3SC1_300001 [Gammaproteobacteria bacterium]
MRNHFMVALLYFVPDVLLAAKPELKAGDLEITSKAGEVTIAGTVDDGRQLYNIADTAQKVPGVKWIVNEMYPKK